MPHVEAPDFDRLAEGRKIAHEAAADRRLARSQEERIAKLETALGGLLTTLDTAGLLNLSNGVQLGQTAWYVKATDAVNYAKAVLKE